MLLKYLLMKNLEDFGIKKSIHGKNIILTLKGDKPIKVKHGAEKILLQLLINIEEGRPKSFGMTDNLSLQYIKKFDQIGYAEANLLYQSSPKRTFFPVLPIFSTTSTRIIDTLGSTFSILHTKEIFWLTGISFTIAVAIFLLEISKSTNQIPMNYPFLIVFILFSGFVHEIGHISASRKLGIRCSELGIALYIFFIPAFFVRINEIYHVPNKKRILINAGGIYFNAIIFSITIFFNYLTGNKYLYLSTILLYSMLINLMPSFKNDGYWIIYDLEIPKAKFFLNILSIMLTTVLIIHNILQSNYFFIIFVIAYSIQILFQTWRNKK